MTDYRVKEIYSLYKNDMLFTKEELEKYGSFLDQYLKSAKIHLFITDNRECEILEDIEMKKKYDSGKYFDSGMFEDDKEWKKFCNDSSSNIYDFVSYKTFCIYNEIKALIYFGKDKDEIIEILNEKYII